MEDEKSFNTFGEVYEISCARYGREADLPITFFKEQLNQAIAGTMTQEAIMELRLKTYESITKNHVSENVFSQVGDCYASSPRARKTLTCFSAPG